MNIGSMHYYEGEVEEALDYFEKARKLLEQERNRKSVLKTLVAVYNNISGIHLVRRNFTSAIETSTEAISFLEEENDVRLKTVALQTLAKAEKESGDIERAIESYRQVILVSNNKASEEVLLELGSCYLAKNDLDMAQKTFASILNHSQQTTREVIRSYDYLARIATVKGAHDEARDHYQHLLEILEGMIPKDENSIAATQANLGMQLLKAGQVVKAMKFFEITVQHFKKKKQWNEVITIGNNYRNELIKNKDFRKALDITQEVIIPALKKTKGFVNFNQHFYDAAFLNHLIGETEKGVQFWRKKREEQFITKILAPSFMNHPDYNDELNNELNSQEKLFRSLIKRNDL
ncbi:MAG: tetratricopeptide repeat protein [Candidatus Odinarchaeota archaeon]